MPAVKAKAKTSPKAKSKSKSKALPKTKANVVKAKGKVKSKAKVVKAKGKVKSKVTAKALPKGKSKAKSKTSKAKVNVSSVYYVPMWAHKNTYAVGVYDTKDEAYDVLVNYVMLIRKNVFNDFKKRIKEIYKIDLTENKFKYILKREWKDVLSPSKTKTIRNILDEIHDELNIEVVEHEGPDMFPFNAYGEWDMNNLFNLVTFINTGKRGEL
jgi:hypothetical protein